MGFTIVYITIGLIIGFGIAWVIGMNKLTTERKQFKSTSGFLESERLIKETLQKELAVVHQQKMTIELELSQKLTAANKTIVQMDSDIMLMQKSYEETEAQLLQTHPELHALKVELIETKNTIARLKAALAEK